MPPSDQKNMRRPFKILMCHNFYTQDGGENTVFRLESDILQKYGHEVQHYLRYNSEIHDNFNVFEKATLLINGIFSHSTYREVKRLVRDFQPDAAIVQNVFPLISPSIYFALKSSSVPVLQLSFNYRFACANGQLYVQDRICERCISSTRLNAALYRCMHNSVARSLWYAIILEVHRYLGTFKRKIDLIIVPHELVGHKLSEDGIPHTMIRRNPNPFFLPEPADVEADPPYLLFVGRLIREKGIFTLLEAMHWVPQPIRLVVVGDGAAMPNVRDYLREHPDIADRIELKGEMRGEAVDELYRGMMLLVQPSEWHDPSPITVYTALALGKPTVVTNLGGCPEIVENGKHGLVFEAGNAKDLADKINRLISDPKLRLQIGRAARSHAVSYLSATRHYERLYSVLQEVTGSQDQQWAL